MHRSLWVAFPVAFGLSALSGVAVADPAGNIPLDTFRPAMDSRGYFTVNASQVLGDKEFSFGLGALDWGSGFGYSRLATVVAAKRTRMLVFSSESVNEKSAPANSHGSAFATRAESSSRSSGRRWLGRPLAIRINSIRRRRSAGESLLR